MSREITIRVPTVSRRWLAAFLCVLAFTAGRLSPRPNGPEPPGPTPVSAAESAGRTQAAAILSSYASAWSTAADEVADGSAVAEALAGIRSRWEADRTAAFEANASPVFDSIVPEGTPPAEITPEQRARLADAFRAFGRGVAP